MLVKPVRRTYAFGRVIHHPKVEYPLAPGLLGQILTSIGDRAAGRRSDHLAR